MCGKILKKFCEVYDRFQASNMYKAGYDRPENAISKIDVWHLT